MFMIQNFAISISFHFIYIGIFSNMFVVKVIKTLDIHGKKMNRQRNTAIIFGTNVKVNSWIWVTAWKRLIISPTSMLTKSAGPETRRIVLNTSAESSLTISTVIGNSLQ